MIGPILNEEALVELIETLECWLEQTGLTPEEESLLVNAYDLLYSIRNGEFD